MNLIFEEIVQFNYSFKIHIRSSAAAAPLALEIGRRQRRRRCAAVLPLLPQLRRIPIIQAGRMSRRSDPSAVAPHRQFGAEDAHHLFDELLPRARPISVRAINNLLPVVAQDELRCTPNVFPYNILLKGHSDENRSQEALEPLST
ncbi:hypothetical protein GUJ93_ZPchr0012g21163 [Zizania palustris]|uniref:Uncharacterized protein n=1 Tax=Zizania palustris TaxID=103762 RepID=A0A8J5WN79_ZIZPA|nr:hypothetical protein GUJ93_ZPchr0012g21163 [Zizania palustris]